jgi:hypothetical protein
LFLEEDALCEGDGNGWESLTGTCIIHFPHWVYVVVTSNISDFGVESCIFGIARLFYAKMMMVQTGNKMGIHMLLMLQSI